MRVTIPAAQIEFDDGGSTIWVISPKGGTLLRVKLTGKLSTRKCEGASGSHLDLLAEGDGEWCLGDDADA